MWNTLISSSPKLAQIYKTKSYPLKMFYRLLPESKQGNIFHHTHYWWREISDIISDLNIRKSTGPNSIPTKVMKQIKDVISAPLAKLINRSFHNGVFPNILKIAEVIPIFKSESRVACNNYRPISLLSNIRNIIEKCINVSTVFWKHKIAFILLSLVSD